MSKKVYCDNCRWYQSGGGFGDEANIIESCNKIIGHSSSYSANKILNRTDGHPSELNKNNDCAYYAWKLQMVSIWWRLW